MSDKYPPDWARSLPHEPGDEKLCAWSPTLRHQYISIGHSGDRLTGPWECVHCGSPDR